MERTIHMDAENGKGAEKTSYLVWCWLLLLGFAGTCLRVRGVGSYHFNTDEMLYLHMAQGKTLGETWQYTMNEMHPPLSTLLMHLWYKISHVPAFLRSLALVFGLLLIPIYYRIGTLISGSTGGLCCAALITFSYGILTQTYLLRNYAGFLVAVSLAFYWALRWHRDQRTEYLVLYAGWGAVACLMDFSGMITIFTIGAGEIFSSMRRARPFRLMVRWMITNGAIACVAIAIFAAWYPTMSFYQSGTLSGGGLHYKSALLPNALLSPLFVLCYLLPAQSQPMIEFSLLVCAIGLIIYAGSCRGILSYLLFLTGIGVLLEIILYVMGAYSVIGYAPRWPQRQNLWLAPFIIPLLGEAMSLVLSHKSFRAYSGLWLALLLIVGGVGLYDPKARFADKEYMVLQKNYEQASADLSKLDMRTLIITDRSAGFLLMPENDKLYQGMWKGGWADGKESRILLYAHTRLLLDAKHLAWHTRNELIHMYLDIESRGILDGTQTLMFVNTAWKQEAVTMLADCKTLTKTVVRFAQQENDKWSLVFVFVPRAAFERDVVASDGKARACFDVSPIPL